MNVPNFDFCVSLHPYYEDISAAFKVKYSILKISFYFASYDKYKITLSYTNMVPNQDHDVSIRDKTSCCSGRDDDHRWSCLHSEAFFFFLLHTEARTKAVLSKCLISIKSQGSLPAVSLFWVLWEIKWCSSKIFAGTVVWQIEMLFDKLNSQDSIGFQSSD